MEKTNKPSMEFPKYYVHKSIKQYIRLENECDGQIISMEDVVCATPGKLCYRFFNYSLRSTDPATITELYNGKNGSYLPTNKDAWNRAIQNYEAWVKEAWASVFKKV